jgi:hypothetical protein
MRIQKGQRQAGDGGGVQMTWRRDGCGGDLSGRGDAKVMSRDVGQQ